MTNKENKGFTVSEEEVKDTNVTDAGNGFVFCDICAWRQSTPDTIKLCQKHAQVSPEKVSETVNTWSGEVPMKRNPYDPALKEDEWEAWYTDVEVVEEKIPRQDINAQTGKPIESEI